MSWVLKFAKSSIGAKILMALTGVVLFGFVIVHLLGNLQIFLGQEAYNGYAAFVKASPEVLWGVRAVLLGAVLLHIVSGLRLAFLNKKARPVAYANKQYVKASWFSRTMTWTGVVLLAFIVYHLLHFTVGVVQPEHFHMVDAKGRHDAYSMFVYGFQNVYVSASYIVAMILLGFHLEHGASSMFQSLGINHPRFNGLLHRIGPVFAVLIVLGNISMPIAVLLGWVTLPAGVM